MIPIQRSQFEIKELYLFLFYFLNINLLLNENEINNNLQNEIYISTNNTFNAIADKIMNLSINITNENNTLISCLKNTMQFDSHIILINCVIP
jgi:hypothetical protein